ncbi:MAG: CehA/McbA family metallohydrolase, partial [Actinomycetota bacterium]|nr:CehA/McbA family metallohydrolase [Actinomycetota bacterium]
TGEVAWRMEMFVTNDPADADAPWEPTPYDDSVVRNPQQAEWYKGDFHVHAEHSNPSDATMRETFDYAFDDRPEGAGLDFITLSDYVTDRHWDEIGRFQADYPDSVIMRSAEIITYQGHINNHDSHTFVDYRTGEIYERQPDGSLTKVRDAQPASRVFDDIHNAGGFTQVNHPTTFPSTVPGFDNLCRGCSWEYSDEETDWSKVDSFEVATGPGGLQEPDGNEPGPNPFSPLAIDWWDRLQVQGFDITAVGSSDSHHADRENLTQSPIGEATTVVLADELSEDGIHAGVLAGHAYVKFFHSDGPDLRISATPLIGGETVIMGDELAAERARFTARVIGGAPSPQVRSLIVMRDGRPISAVPVPNDDFTFEFTASTPGDYRLQLHRGTAVEALTNPINLVAPLPPDPPPTDPPPPEPEPEDTTLFFTGDSAVEGQHTDSVPIEARLIDSEGNGIEGETVDFHLAGRWRDKQWSVTTDDRGFARQEVLLDRLPGHYLLTAQYGGDEETYGPSADSLSFRLRREETILDLEVRREPDGRRHLAALLYEHDVPDSGIGRREIDFFIDGKFAGMRYTRRGGIALRRISKATLQSADTLGAKFAGGNRFKPSSDSVERG